MALALYRKYRPRTFAEVIGQEHVTEPLMQALRTGRLNHAYLFSGPRGCGKTSSARILARSLNCEKGPTPEPCGECDSCVALAPDGPGSIDVIEIDAASHGGVDDARDLRERAFFAPVSSRFKVYIIDEAHMVSTQGFNALLKLVEEPPEYVKFVFATTEPEKVLGTIRSRTHHYPFRLIPPNVLRPFLEKLCQQEGVSVEPAIFPLIVRAGGGSARDSLSVLDQLIAGAGVQGVTYSRAVALLGVTDVALIDEMADALAAGDGAAAFATIDRVADAGHDPRRFTSDLLERLRDLIVLQKVPDAAGSGIIEAPSDQLERMTGQASRMGPATLSRLADIAHSGLTEMRGTTAPRLLLELVVARMLLPGAEESHGALLQRLERMERRLGAAAEPFAVGPADAGPPTLAEPTSSGPAARTRPAPDRVRAAPSVPVPPPPIASPPASPPGPVPAIAAVAEVAEPPDGGLSSDHAAPVDGEVHPAGPGALDAAAVRRVWDEILLVVRRRSPRAWAVVREASVRDVHADEIVLVFQHAVHANMFGAQADLLVDGLREVLGGNWRVRAELGNDDRARPAGRPASEPARPATSAPTAPSTPAPTAQAATPHVPAQGAAASARQAPARPASQGAPSGPARPAAGTTATGTSTTGTATTGTTTRTATTGTATTGTTVGGGDGDWPTPATPGGGGGGAAPLPAESVPRPSRGPAGSAPRPGRGQAESASARPARSQADGSFRTGQADGGRGKPAAVRPMSTADGPPPEEPPFDPEYDELPPSGYEAFDPGDESLGGSMGSASTGIGETSEEQAVRVLTEHFGAERIGEGKP